MAEKAPEPTNRKRKSIFEMAENKRQLDRERSKTKVCLGDYFGRWRVLKQRMDLKTDAFLAKFLLDSFEKLTEASSAEKPKQDTSSPTSGPQLNNDKKLTKAETQASPATSSPTSGPQSNHDDRSQLTTPSPLSGPLLTKCPSCGFALSQWSLQNGNTQHIEHQPESIEVTLELEQRDEPVSGAEEADGESDESEQEEESDGSGVDEGYRRGQSSDEDWTPARHNTLTEAKPNPTETTSAEVQSTQKVIKLKKQLCVECGVFYLSKLHECEHKTRPFVCNICGKRFGSEPALKVHNKIHLETYEHSCKYCYANFKTRVDKLEHEMVHREQKDPHKCPDCAETFVTYREREEHLKIHKKQVKCAVCGIVFKDKSRYLRHMVVHTGEKPFRCSVCEQRFNQEGHLKSHMRLHTGERPYSCKHCDKSFNHNVSLKSHVQRYHPTEQEDNSRHINETETGAEIDTRGDKKGAATKSKNKRPPTGRPRGRPKRYTAVEMQYSNTMDAGDDDESEKDPYH